jgi:hypothetical protein
LLIDDSAGKITRELLWTNHDIPLPILSHHVFL